MGLFFAWMVGESIVFYRWGKLKAPPTPGVLVSSSIVFGGLALVSLYTPAKTFATITAFTYDLAILMQVVGKAPTQTTGWPPPQITSTTAILPDGTADSGADPPGGAPAGGGKKWNIWTGYL